MQGGEKRGDRVQAELRSVLPRLKFRRSRNGKNKIIILTFITAFAYHLMEKGCLC